MCIHRLLLCDIYSNTHKSPERSRTSPLTTVHNKPNNFLYRSMPNSFMRTLHCAKPDRPACTSKLIPQIPPRARRCTKQIVSLSDSPYKNAHALYPHNLSRRKHSTPTTFPSIIIATKDRRGYIYVYNRT